MLSSQGEGIAQRLARTNVKLCKRVSKLENQRRQETVLKNSGNISKGISVSETSNAHHSITSLMEKLNYNCEAMSVKTHNCYYIQDKFMNAFYNYYPEVICFDVLCYIPEIDYNLALLFGLDTNGHCKIIAIGFIKSGILEGYNWFCEVFKKENHSWSKIEIIICNHSFDSVEILDKVFSNKNIFCSLFYLIKSFQNDLSCLETELSDADVNKALQIFEEMFFISSESGYLELLKKMKQVSVVVFNVFKKNWHAKKEMWALGLKFSSRIFFNTINSFLLFLRKELKSTVSTQKSLESVILKLHHFVNKTRNEFFQKFTCMFMHPTALNSEAVILKYSKYLTPFAVELIKDQFSLIKKFRNIKKIDQCTYNINGLETNISSNTCSCSFQNSLRMPCVHIFVVRKSLSLSLYVNSFQSSWIANEYQKVFLDLYSLFSSHLGHECSDKKLRYFESIKTSEQIWNLIFDNNDVSQSRLEDLRNILKSWKYNFKIKAELSQNSNNSSTNADVFENIPTDHLKDIYGISVTDMLETENDFSFVSLCSESENELF